MHGSYRSGRRGLAAHEPGANHSRSVADDDYDPTRPVRPADTYDRHRHRPDACLQRAHRQPVRSGGRGWIPEGTRGSAGSGRPARGSPQGPATCQEAAPTARTSCDRRAPARRSRRSSSGRSSRRTSPHRRRTIGAGRCVDRLRRTPHRPHRRDAGAAGIHPRRSGSANSRPVDAARSRSRVEKRRAGRSGRTPSCGGRAGRGGDDRCCRRYRAAGCRARAPIPGPCRRRPSHVHTRRSIRRTRPYQRGRLLRRRGRQTGVTARGALSSTSGL